MNKNVMQAGSHPCHVSLVALPDAAVSTLFGIYDVMNAFSLLEPLATNCKPRPPFHIHIVGESKRPLTLASGIAIDVQRAIDSIEITDIVIVPSILLRSDGWGKRRYPALVEWLCKMHERGAVLCSACSGIFLLAETVLFDGKDVTVHFGYAREFATAYPAMRVHPERVLVIAGLREELVSSGASATWHDLVLYLIARFAGSTTAQDVARMFALQWHHDGLTPYIVFEGKSDHGDGEIHSAQQWLSHHFSVANPVHGVIKRSKLAERTEDSVDKISWRAGYEDAAFFRRLFKRTTGLSPGAYRKRFPIPDFAQPVRRTMLRQPEK